MLDYIHNVREYLDFDKKEIWAIVVSILLFTLVLGYDDGYDSFIAARYFLNLFDSFIIATSLVLAKELGQKLFAISRGYTVKIKLWYPMVIIQLLVLILTQGSVHIILPVMGMFIHHNEKLRLGRFRFGHHYFDNAIIAFTGPLTSIYFAYLFKIFSNFSNPLIEIAMLSHIIYALVNMLPLDFAFILRSNRHLEHADIDKHPAPFTGTYIFAHSRTLFIFCISSLCVLSAGLVAGGIILSTFLAFLFAGTTWLIVGYYRSFDLH